MIQHLSISNYALIDKLDISFAPGLTIITGETGAGKSVLLGALALILGQRADSTSLPDKAKKCTVEAEFLITPLQLQPFFKENDLDYEAVCTIRREISPEGKSRAFINDTPVNLQVLKELGERLIDIHSQHETLTLSDSDFQLAVLDTYAGNEPALKTYKQEYLAYRQLEAKLKSLIEEEAASNRDLDYFKFQFTELDEAGLDQLDMEGMEAELELLNNSESIKNNLGRAATALQGGESNLVASLNEVNRTVAGLARFNATLAALSGRLNSTYIELKDIAAELDGEEQRIVFDAGRVAELTARLDSVYRLLKKHQVKEVKELRDIREELSNRLLGISSLETEIKAIREQLKKSQQALLQKAGGLSEKRNKSTAQLEKEITGLLTQLGMPNAQLTISCQLLPVAELNMNGQDRVNFFFSANKGGEPKALNKVASGGELSRLMLSIKSILAKKSSLPAVIFDEIDTGVSGDVADKVGIIMEKMAGAMQVITITHLPQIASKGGAHLFVYKEISGQKTVTRIRALKQEERIQEIAKMLSSGQPGPAALKNAKELLNS